MNASKFLSARDAALSPEALELIYSLRASRDKGQMIGPYLMGAILDALFCGVIIVQFISWHSYDMHDRRFTKTIVNCLFLAGLGYSIWIIVLAMHLFVFNFGLYAPFVDINWIQFCAIGEVVVAVFAQAFYAERVYRLLNNSKVFLAVILPALLLEIGAALWGVVITRTLSTLLQVADGVQASMRLNLSAQMLSDVIITGFTAYALYKNKTGINRTDRLIDRLLLYTFETQLRPTIWVLISLCYWSANPESTMVVFMNILMSKPYTICVLAVLNSRSKLRRQMLPESDRKNDITPSENMTDNGLGTEITDTYLYDHSASYHPFEPLKTPASQDCKTRMDEESSIEGPGANNNTEEVKQLVQVARDDL